MGLLLYEEYTVCLFHPKDIACPKSVSRSDLLFADVRVFMYFLPERRLQNRRCMVCMYGRPVREQVFFPERIVHEGKQYAYHLVVFLCVLSHECVFSLYLY